MDDPAELDYAWEDLLRKDLNGDGLVSKEELVLYCLGEEPLTPDGAFEDAELEAQASRARHPCSLSCNRHRDNVSSGSCS